MATSGMQLSDVSSRNTASCFGEYKWCVEACRSPYGPGPRSLGAAGMEDCLETESGLFSFSLAKKILKFHLLTLSVYLCRAGLGVVGWVGEP